MFSWYLDGGPVDFLVEIMCSSMHEPQLCSTGRMIILILNLPPGAESKSKLPSMPSLTSLSSRPCASRRAARVACLQVPLAEGLDYRQARWVGTVPVFSVAGPQTPAYRWAD